MIETIMANFLEAFHHIVFSAPKVIIEGCVFGVELFINRLIFWNGVDDFILQFAHLLGGNIDIGINAALLS